MRLGPNEHASPLLARDQPFGFQERKGAPDGRPTRLELPCQLVLRRELLTSFETPIKDRRAQLVDDALVREAAWHSK